MSTEDDVLASGILLRIYTVLDRLQGSHPDPERGRVLDRIRPLRNRVAYNALSRDGVMREFKELLPDIAGYLSLIESSSLGSVHARLVRSVSLAEEIGDVLLDATEREEARPRRDSMRGAPAAVSAVRQVEATLQETASPLVLQARGGDRDALDELRGMIDRMTQAYCRVRVGEHDGSYIFADAVARESTAEAFRTLVNNDDASRSIVDVVFRFSDATIASSLRGEFAPVLRSVAERSAYLEALFRDLSDGQRDVLLLRVALGLSVKETAQMLGTTAGAVRAAHHRALERLRSELALVLEPPSPLEHESPAAGDSSGSLRAQFARAPSDDHRRRVAVNGPSTLEREPERVRVTADSAVGLENRRPPGGIQSSGAVAIAETEEAVQTKLGAVPLHREQMAAVSNIHRAATAIRQHLENSVLRTNDLTWTGFVVLWVVWIWGEMETRYVAEEAGISTSDLVGVAKTLRARGLLERASHPTDRRLVHLRLTSQGEELMADLFPKFNEEEVFVSGPLESSEAQSLAEMLRRMVTHLEANGEQRRLDLRGDIPLPPRRSGRGAKHG